MKRSIFAFVVMFSALAAVAAGCASEDAPVNRVGVNVVDKSTFEGSWYYHRVVVDVDYESAGMGTYQGDAAYNFALGGDNAFTIERIRWVIDENFLYAYRDYHLIEESGVPNTDFTGQPVAAFAIEGHFDIRREFNPSTGEEYNVVSEDDATRRWYERQFVRVDWSQNLISVAYGQEWQLNARFGLFKHESAPLYVQNESLFPDSWRPQFHYMGCDGQSDTSEGCTDIDRDNARDYDKGELYSMNFVTQEIMSPGNVPDPFTGEPVNFCASIYSDAPDCVSAAIYVRNAFLKVSDRRQYEAANWTDDRWERAGYFRLERRTVDRSSGAGDPAFGETDFLNYSSTRHNIWYQWHDAAGQPVPYEDRDVRRIVWYTTPELPAHLVKPALDVGSEWNAAFMQTVRNAQGRPAAEYPAVECQRTDPDGYCFCVENDDREVINPTCEGKYNAFETKQQAESRGAVNAYDCHVTVPAGAEPDMTDAAVASRLKDEDFYGWYGAKFEGSECVNVVRINTCNRATVAAAEAEGKTEGDLNCEQRGDIRYKFLSYVDQPGTDFLGIASLRGDPVSGEVIAGDANIGGPALDGYRTSALYWYDLINGNLSERDISTGDDLRRYLQSLDQIDLPAPPRVDFLVANQKNLSVPSAMRGDIDRKMQSVLPRLEALKGPEGRAQILSDRLSRLAGTPLERRLLSNTESLVQLGVDRLPEGRDASSISEHILDRVSPFRGNTGPQKLSQGQAYEKRLAQRAIHMPNEFIDNSVLQFVNKHRSWPRARVEFELNRLMYFETQLHEAGHCYGLRHDPAGSADRRNYHDMYFAIDDAFPLPDANDYEKDGDPGFSEEESAAFETAYSQAREKRELAGIDGFMNASVMEYTSNWYERLQPLGHYDHAAINFGYGDYVELYDNVEERNVAALTPVNTARPYVKYYKGGETCETDAECPYSAEGTNASELTQMNIDAGLVQRCVAHPTVAIAKICSTFDADSAALDDSDSTPRYAPVQYRYCSDEQAGGSGFFPGTTAWCNYFDEGESYREIVRNIWESYQRMYLFSNFRRYRANWDIGSYINSALPRRYGTLINIFQNMIYSYVSQPEFRTTTGNFGFYDQFLASADVMNFFAYVLGLPDVGTYKWNSYWDRYEPYGSDPNEISADADVKVPIGLGRYVDSEYQRGLSGIERVERVGTLYDKIFALQFMALRGLRSDYTPDVPLWANFYDIFPNETQQIFGGMIRLAPEEYMPRLECDPDSAFPNCDAPRVTYMDFYRGDCSEGSETCRPSPTERYSGDVLNGGAHFVMQFYAALYGMTEFPTFFDTTFQNQLFICVEGQGSCQRPGPGSVEGVDHIRYTSSRFNKTYLAWKLQPGLDVAEQSSIGFAFLREASDFDFIFQMLRKYRGDFGGAANTTDNLTPGEITRLAELDYVIPSTPAFITAELNRLDARVNNLESFFSQLIQLDQELGINSYLN